MSELTSQPSQLSYLIGSFAHFIYESKDLDQIIVSNLFSSGEHLKSLHFLYKKIISTAPRTLSSFSLTTRMPDEISPKLQIMTFTCTLGMQFKNPTVFFKQLQHPQQKWQFIAGVVDSSSIFKWNPDLKDYDFSIVGGSEHFLMALAEFVNIPATLTVIGTIYQLQFMGPNILDFLGNPNFQEFSQVRGLEFRQQILTSNGSVCKIHLNDSDAVFPQKAHFSDAGYDLTIIRKVKQLGTNTNLYDTGIAVELPFGFYAEIYPRSSLSKTGFMLSNSVGIIDRSYRGNLFIALTKIDPNAADITFPFRCAQLIFRKQEFIPLENGSSGIETGRATGGFGSSGL